jgi:hypothetical protein
LLSNCHLKVIEVKRREDGEEDVSSYWMVREENVPGFES